MHSHDVDEQVRRTVAGYLEVPPERLVDDAMLGDDLCVDSLMALEMVTEVEDALGVRLPEDVLDGVRTYGDFRRAAHRGTPVTAA